MSGVPYTPPTQPQYSFVSTSPDLYRSIPIHSVYRSMIGSSSDIDIEVLLPSAQIALNELFHKDNLFIQFVGATLDLMNKEPNEPDEDLQATAFSVSQTLYLVPLSRLILAQKWEMPIVVTDGYGGLRLSWSRNGRDVRISIPSTDSQKRRLYWENGDQYGSLSDFTPTTLSKFLLWMTDDTRSVAAA